MLSYSFLACSPGLTTGPMCVVSYSDSCWHFHYSRTCPSGSLTDGERSSELFYPWEGPFSCLSFLWCCFMYCLCTTVLGVSTLTVYRLLMTFVKTWRSTIKGNPLTVPISDIFLVMNKYRMWLWSHTFYTNLGIYKGFLLVL